MTDAFEYFLPIIETHQSMVSRDEVSRWPIGVLESLIGFGILVSSENATIIRCPECGEHWEEVIATEGPAGSSRFFVTCPESWRVEVSHEQRQQWHVNFNALVNLMATSMELTGKPTILLHDRLWRIGRMTWCSQARDVLFVRGLGWDDGEQVRRAISRTRRPIVFSSTYAMPDEFWPTSPPQLVLRNVASLEDDFQVDVVEITTCLDDAANRRTGEPMRLVTREELSQLVHREIKAEQKTRLIDEFYLRAYRQEGSVRKAADFLTKETGQPVSKDAVQRAVNRNGGASAVLESEDSNSIVRGVASQDRDKKGKILNTAKP